MSAKVTNMKDTENGQIGHVINRDKKYLSEHGQKLFNAINCLLDDEEQLELTQALFKYQREHNVFTLVRSCRELFDTPRKKSLMLFMRPVIPIKDRFHYDEYYKLFFPEEFSTEVKSIFSDLIPKDLLEKTIRKANEKMKAAQQEEKDKQIKILETPNTDLNVDLDKLMSKNESQTVEHLPTEAELIEQNTAQIAGFRIIDLAPDENESLGFDVCLGPTGTFIMISYIEPDSLVSKMGMKVGDELVSVNDISFKMIDVEQAIEVLSTQPTLRIVLQKSGFMPEDLNECYEKMNLESNSGSSLSESSSASVVNQESAVYFNNDWLDTFGNLTKPPTESKSSFKKHLRRVYLRPRINENGIGFSIRGGIEYSLGVFVSHVVPKSNADLMGLRVSDQIIEVNGQKFSRISLEEAKHILETNYSSYVNKNLPIKLTIRYLGRLPVLVHQGKKIMNNQNDVEIQSVKWSRLNQNTAKLLANLFETKNDYLMVKYYLNEYLSSKLNIQHLTYLLKNMKLFDLTGEMKKSELLNQELLCNVIKDHCEKDFEVYQQIVNNGISLTDSGHFKSRILSDDFKNSLIVSKIDIFYFKYFEILIQILYIR